MADVTISSLPLGTPSGSGLIPFSSGSNTLGVPVSAIFQNSDYIGIGASIPRSSLHLRGPVGDICLDSNAVTNARWRILPQTGMSTKLFRIYDDTEDKDRLTIDDQGRVLTPAQPAFRAWNSTAQALQGNALITFNSTNTAYRLLNQGNNFNNNRFTAPVTGLYHFALNLLLNTGSGGGYWGVGLMSNDTFLDFCYALGTTQQSLCMSTIVKLNHGDWVEARATTNGTINLDNSGSFSGYLVG